MNFILYIASQELFPKLHQLTEDQKYSCSIYAFLAHQPTMTFSRVEAFGTGSIPPFLKMAKSFQVENVYLCKYNMYKVGGGYNL